MEYRMGIVLLRVVLINSPDEENMMIVIQVTDHNNAESCAGSCVGTTYFGLKFGQCQSAVRTFTNSANPGSLHRSSLFLRRRNHASKREDRRQQLPEPPICLHRRQYPSLWSLQYHCHLPKDPRQRSFDSHCDYIRSSHRRRCDCTRHMSRRLHGHSYPIRRNRPHQ